MVGHPTFEQQIDWLEGRLDGETHRSVSAHLSAGCGACEGDLSWLRRIRLATRADHSVEPPVEMVARAQALYRPELVRLPAQARRWWPLPVLRPALAFIVMVALALTGYMVQRPGLLAREGRVLALQGAAELRSQGQESWQAADAGSVLREGDQVRARGGAALLTLFDGSQLEMQPSAVVTLVHMRSSLVGRPYQVQVAQSSGYVLYNVAHLRGARSAFQVQAPTARIAVRGTSFAVAVESDVETRVIVLEGRVQVAGAQDESILSEREGVVIRAAGELVRLPTLTPTPTAIPSASRMPSVTPSQHLAVSPTPGGSGRERTPQERATQSAPTGEGPRGEPEVPPTTGALSPTPQGAQTSGPVVATLAAESTAPTATPEPTPTRLKATEEPSEKPEPGLTRFASPTAEERVTSATYPAPADTRKHPLPWRPTHTPVAPATPGWSEPTRRPRSTPSVEPVDTLEPPDSTPWIRPTRTSAPPKPTWPPRPTDTPEPRDPTKPAVPTRPTEPPDPTKPARPTRTPEPPDDGRTHSAAAAIDNESSARAGDATQVHTRAAA